MTLRLPRDIGAILFDKDGTLFDFAATWEAWTAGFLVRLADGDRARAGALGDLIGYDLERARLAPDSFLIAGTPEDLVDALLPEFPDLSRRDLFKRINDEAASVRMVEAVSLAPLLDRLIGHGLHLGIATNDAEGPTLVHLDTVGVRDRFSFVAGSDSGFGAKPEPGQLRAFCNAIGVPPVRSVMVGDSTHDLVAGRAAGMATVAVLTGMAGTDDLAPYADVVLPDIGHLPEWLGLS
ncbi:HAD family hydrolase [Marivita sp.]|uniref:HAD family hydrolase n=1 Tax=Marivita sp. TaxID=2003365 RepID=UPI0025C33D1C|nr:HAD family hydrolase [Marivita sp.]